MPAAAARQHCIRPSTTFGDPTRQDHGCIEYNAFQSVRDLDEFYSHSRWRDQAAFEQHVALPHTVTFAASVEALNDHPLAVSLKERLE